MIVEGDQNFGHRKGNVGRAVQFRTMSDEPGSSSIDIEIVTLDQQWSGTLSGCADVALRAARAAIGDLAGESGEISVVLADDPRVRALNREYRGQDKPTNVLSFPNMEAPPAAGGGRLLGDVVLARETLKREAQEQHKSLEDHLAHLVVHGVLHLLGYDHEEAAEAAEMEACERRILADLGIADPYKEAESQIRAVKSW